MTQRVPDTVVEEGRLTGKRVECQRDRRLSRLTDHVAETGNLDLDRPDEDARHLLHKDKLSKGMRQGKRKAAIDKPLKLSPQLEREVDELAAIIVEFYREWKQQ